MDFTLKDNKELAKKVILEETGMSVSEFKKQSFSRAMGELISGNNSIRKQFEKEMFNKDVEQLLKNKLMKPLPVSNSNITEKADDSANSEN